MHKLPLILAKSIAILDIIFIALISSFDLSHSITRLVEESIFVWSSPPSVIAEQIILNTLVLAGKEGIAKKDLLQKVFPLDQSNVYRISKKLKEQGLIKIIRYGQRTRYFAVNSSRRNVGLGAYLLGNGFVGNYSLLGKE